MIPRGAQRSSNASGENGALSGAVRVLILIVVAAGAVVDAQRKPPVQLPRGQAPDLGRPTKKDDPLPTLDFEQYFVGTSLRHVAPACIPPTGSAAKPAKPKQD